MGRKKNRARSRSSANQQLRSRNARVRLFRLTATVLLLAIGVFILLHFLPKRDKTRPVSSSSSTKESSKEFHTLDELLKLTPAQREHVDIGLMNLYCAQGLRGSENLDIPSALKTLDLYAAHVDRETERHMYRFRKNPQEYNNSEAYFRMLMLAVVLQQDFHVHYNLDRITTPGVFESNDVFFASSKDVFIHGPLGNPATGTCSSMPVFYVAIGRRLGYPLFLASTKCHLFVRWEDAQTRFNVDATSVGLNTYDDEHYKSWPFKITEEEIKQHCYLKSLNSTEELAVFMTIRGACLMSMRRYNESIVAYTEAQRLDPDNRSYRIILAMAQEEAAARKDADQKATDMISNLNESLAVSQRAIRQRQMEDVPSPISIPWQQPVQNRNSGLPKSTSLRRIPER
jgi:tetratricopeptide (TPR) repeat protein